MGKGSALSLPPRAPPLEPAGGVTSRPLPHDAAHRAYLWGYLRCPGCHTEEYMQRRIPFTPCVAIPSLRRTVGAGLRARPLRISNTHPCRCPRATPPAVTLRSACDEGSVGDGYIDAATKRCNGCSPSSANRFFADAQNDTEAETLRRGRVSVPARYASATRTHALAPRRIPSCHPEERMRGRICR